MTPRFSTPSPGSGQQQEEDSFPLTAARCGQRLRIVSLRAGSSACARLREMGFCEKAEVCKVVDGSALICVLQGVRLAIGRNLGQDVLVQPLPPSPPSTR